MDKSPLPPGQGLPPAKQVQIAELPPTHGPSYGAGPSGLGRHSIQADIGPHGEFQVVSGQIPEGLIPDLKRDFTDDEKEEIFGRIHKTLAPSCKGSKERPCVLWVLGPSAVGKSFISAAKASTIFGSEYNGVMVDGAEFRQVHAGFQAVAVHGMEHGLLHADLWKIFKSLGTENGGQGISSALKAQIMQAP